jgi:NADP-reducing hydrogenase subunit HndD
MENIKIKVNNIDIEAHADSTILEAARLANIHIPTLCYLKDVNEIGACRMCVVKVKGAKGLMPACVTIITPNMEVWTDTPDVIESRRKTLDLICSNHRMDCEYCDRYSDCELYALLLEYGLDDKQYSMSTREPDYDDSAVHLIRDKSKCVLCRRCVNTCSKNQLVGAIGVLKRGYDIEVGPPLPLADTSCVNCGQCIAVCPTGALTVKDDTRKVWMAINNPSKHVVAAVSPFVSAQLGEHFSETIGTNVEGKMIAALRCLGFDRIFDMRHAATLTVMEQGYELLSRLKNNGKLPLISSCCPSWVKFCEVYYPELLENLSICKSPREMFGALCKCWYAKKVGIDPKDIFMVSIDTCTAGKFECQRREMTASGYPDVDVCLTTSELAAMIKRSCVSKYTSLKVWNEVSNEAFDPFLGMDTRAGSVFGATGGVTEATLSLVSGKEVTATDFQEVTGAEVIHEAQYHLNGIKIKVAAVSGLANAAKLLDIVKSGEKDYAFIEVMACPGGCVNGGGQPRHPGDVHNFTDLKADRSNALYSKDAFIDLHKSYQVPKAQQLYEELISEMGKKKVRKLLHTAYIKRSLC